MKEEHTHGGSLVLALSQVSGLPWEVPRPRTLAHANGRPTEQRPKSAAADHSGVSALAFLCGAARTSTRCPPA